ncbi:MAG: hypothetical protein NTZ07_01905, partial [Candidatus Woesebacteria bacterium]|nr:hypothetical protein [Candidatus Woesebacteria bacterium]
TQNQMILLELLISAFVVVGVALCATFVWPMPQLRQAIIGSAPIAGPRGPAGRNADPAVLLQDPAFLTAMREALANNIDRGTMPVGVVDVSHNAWNIQGTDRLKDNPVVEGWLARLKDPAPSLWKTFPNIPNTDVPEFRVVKCADNPSKDCVPDGMEYGTYDSPFCSSHPCDMPVGAWEYRYITGDYKFLDTGCKGEGGRGCMLILVNIMDQSYTFRDQDVDNGFTLRGRYFNGDALEWGIWGLVSNGAANMLNMPTLAHPGEGLNSGDPGNSGANCGNPEACSSVDVMIVVHAGDAIIAVAKTTVTRP